MLLILYSFATCTITYTFCFSTFFRLFETVLSQGPLFVYHLANTYYIAN